MIFYKAAVCISLLQAVVSAYDTPLTATNYDAGGGHERAETIDDQGNVNGQYSYVDPDGKTISVRYRAGVGGTQVEGAHLPRIPGASMKTRDRPRYEPEYQQPEKSYHQKLQQFQAQQEPDYPPMQQAAYQRLEQDLQYKRPQLLEVNPPQYQPARQPQYRQPEALQYQNPQQSQYQDPQTQRVHQPQYQTHQVQQVQQSQYQVPQTQRVEQPQYQVSQAQQAHRPPYQVPEAQQVRQPQYQDTHIQRSQHQNPQQLQYSQFRQSTPIHEDSVDSTSYDAPLDARFQSDDFTQPQYPPFTRDNGGGHRFSINSGQTGSHQQ